MIEKVNHPAVLISAAAYYVLGWLWYEGIFRESWHALVGVSVAAVNASDPVPYIVAAATSLVLAYVTAIALGDRRRTAVRGAQFGLLLGVGLVASTMLENYLYEGRPVTLWLINAGYVVIGLTMMGAIVGGWKKAPAS